MKVDTSNRENMVRRLSVSLDCRADHAQMLMDRCGRLFHLDLRNMICSMLDRTCDRYSLSMSIDRLHVDLGNISEIDFDAQFCQRFARDLERQLEYFNEIIKTQQVDKERITVVTPSATTGETTDSIMLFDHYLQHGRWPQPEVWQGSGGVEDWFAAQSKASPDLWRQLIASSCLSRPARRRLQQLLSPETLCAWLELTGPVTPHGLLLGALHYLQKNSHQRVLLPEVEAKVLAVPTAGHEELLVRLFSVPAPQRLLPWLQALWRHQPLRNWAESRLPAERLRAFRQERIDARPRAVASSMPLTGSHESPPELTTLPVANAGLVLLWPLLPDLFARLGLWKNGAFTDMQAQINAACWLDAAIWAGDCAREWRMPLTKLLCGLPLESELEWQAPNEAAAAQLHQWLVALSAQLPGWRTLGTADIQTLFLQRPGRLERVDTAFTLAVQPEPFDILLSDWPWPLDALMLPWLERPLCIQWPSLSEQGRYQMSSGPVQ